MGDIVDIEKVVEQGKSIVTGESIPKSPEAIQRTLEKIGNEFEQVRYVEGEKLSETGQAVLKDLEEILISGADITSAIPSETFLHIARAQQKVSEASSTATTAMPELAEGQEALMNLGSLLRIMFTSSEFRDVVSDWSNWLKTALIVQLEDTTEKLKEEIGQVPIGEVSEFPEVTSDQLDKLIEMFEWLEEKEEYQRGIGYIFSQISEFPFLLGIEEEASGKPETTLEESKRLKEALEESKLIGIDTLKAVENWTNRSTDQFQDHLKSFSEHLKSDEDLRSSIQALAHFLSNCFNEPGFLNDRKWIRDEARDRLDSVRRCNEKEGYKDDLQGLFDESRELIKLISREPRTALLKESFRKLVEDLFVSQDAGAGGGEGFRLKTELINDLGVIVGDLLQRVKYLRVPDLEIHDEDLDFTARNIILEAAELIPQQFKMTLVTENMFEKAKQKQFEAEESEAFLEPRERVVLPSGTSEWQTHLKFEVKGIHGHCRNVHFNVRKRSGFPQLTDEGLADLRVWGRNGMLIKVVIKPEWIKQETVEKEIHLKETTSQSTSFTPITTPYTTTAVPVTPKDTTSSSSSKITSSDSTRKFKLSIVKAHCDIDELELDLHGTRRDWFYSIMGPIVRKRVKSAMESAIENNLLSLTSP